MRPFKFNAPAWLNLTGKTADTNTPGDQAATTGPIPTDSSVDAAAQPPAGVADIAARVQEAQERAAREQKEAAARQVAGLKQTLQQQINKADLAGAYQTARQVLRLDPSDKDAWEFKAYLEKQQPELLPKEWQYVQNRQQCGPISAFQLKQLLLTRQLRPKTPIWKAGMVNWLPAVQVKELFAEEGRQTCPWCVEDWIDPAGEDLYACVDCENFFLVSAKDLPIPEGHDASSKWAHAHQVTVYRCGGCTKLVYVPESVRRAVTCPHCGKKRQYWGHGIELDDGIKNKYDSERVFFQCPKCSTRLFAAQEDGGMIVLCKSCKSFIEVPSTGWLGRWSSQLARPAITQYHCRHCTSVIDKNQDRCSRCGKFQSQCNYCLMDVPRFARACHHCTRSFW